MQQSRSKTGCWPPHFLGSVALEMRTDTSDILSMFSDKESHLSDFRLNADPRTAVSEMSPSSHRTIPVIRVLVGVL